MLNTELIVTQNDTELSYHFTNLEKKYYEYETCHSIINFILSHSELQNEYNYYLSKMIDLKINYEQEKSNFYNFLINNYYKNNQLYQWTCDFYQGKINIVLKE